MKTWTKELPFFGVNELACKSSGLVALDIRFAIALQRLRLGWNKPLTLNSCCRTPDHNTSIGGHPRSLHLTENPRWNTWGTMAADIDWKQWDPERRLRFARLCWQWGWSVGLHESFIHIDRRVDIWNQDGTILEQRVYTYSNWEGFKKEAVPVSQN